MTALTRRALLGAIAAGVLLGGGMRLAARQSPINTQAIDQAFGIQGQLQGDVYRVTFPRTDLSVTADRVSIKPGLALGSWAAFRRAGVAAVIHGDLVLLETEINPVISALYAANFDITALHNHLSGETPHVMYLHYWGMGAEATLAQGLKTALATTATPMRPAPAAPPPAGSTPSQQAGFDVDTFQRLLGRAGMVRGGVLGVSIPRPERITMMGIELPPAMGMATAINVQSDGSGQIAATGDFVMSDDEVNPIARALRSHNIAITALHNHMLHGTPTLYFMHFWAHGSVDVVATGLKAAADLLKK